jgi:hypothetical protein
LLIYMVTPDRRTYSFMVVRDPPEALIQPGQYK